MGMLRELIKVMSLIILALYYCRTFGRKADIPSDIADLGYDECRLGAHFAYFIPHREYKALDCSARLRMVSKQVLALIDCVIGDLTGLFIHGGSHSAAVEVIDRMTVIAESYAC